MGCGCGKKSATTVASTQKKNTAAAPVGSAAKKNEDSVPMEAFSKKKTPKGIACPEKYDELVIMERKAVALHNKFRFSQIGYRFAETQKMIRGWIVGLSKGCPDEDSFDDMRDFINLEYSKYFSVKR